VDLHAWAEGGGHRINFDIVGRTDVLAVEVEEVEAIITVTLHITTPKAHHETISHIEYHRLFPASGLTLVLEGVRVGFTLECDITHPT
jgi:hypothetical protein